MSTLPPPLILGLDPGYDRLGWALIIGSRPQARFLKAGVIQTKATDSTFVRYQFIQNALASLFTQHPIDLIAIEEVFFSTNRKTALRVAEARGVILASCLRASSAPILELHPQTVKQAITGHGRADKLALARQLARELKLPTQLGDDATDAIALALTAHFQAKRVV